MSVRTRYLATTLALLTLGLGFGLSQWRARPELPRPPRAVTFPSPAALPPTADEVLERADELRLSREQARHLSALKQAWITEAERLDAAVQAASAEFDQFAAAAKSGGGASLQEIQRRSADLRDLSVERRERRAAHGREVLGLLTDSQRAKLQAGTGHTSGGQA